MQKKLYASGQPTVLTQQKGTKLVKTSLMTLADDFMSVASKDDFLDPDPVRWMLTHFRVPETPDHHLILSPYQVAVLRLALTVDENGNFPYSLILWSDIKKSIKSTIAAAVVLWRAFNTPWGSIKIVANDLKQADSRVAFYARRAIELNPEMRKVCRVKPSGYQIDLPNRCRIEAIPIDPEGEAGGNDDMVCFSELWGAQHKASKKMWTELTLPPAKFGKSFRWVETYAGHSGEAPLLEQLYIQGVKEGAKIDEVSEQFDPPLEIYHNLPARMLCLWNTTPRLSWQTPEYYAQEEAILLPHEFLRVHRNQWVTSEDVFVPAEWWASCKQEIPPIEKDAPCIMALDAAVSNDTFGVLLVSGAGDGINYWVRYARKWSPKGKEQRIDFQEPEDEIRRLIAEYNVLEINYDPYQLEDMAGRLRKDLVVRMRPFNQGKDRLLADKQLHDMIRDRRIHHSGEADLAEHITNANSTADGDSLRIIKRSELLKIDLAVCLSMALARAVHWQL